MSGGFLAPAFFGLAALTIPIFLLYMLRLRRTEMPISSTFLWQQLVRDREANAPWQRLRPHPLMLLQLLILAALVMALVRPFQNVDTFASGRTVLLLDATASMNATDEADGQSRFEAAQEIALDNIDALSTDDTMTVIRVAEIAEVLAADSRDRSVLRRAIRDAEPSTSTGDWEGAFALAAAGGRGVENLRVVVLTDGGLPVNLPEIPGDIVYARVGRENDNLAITALAVRALPNSLPQLFAQVSNVGERDSEFIFELAIDGDFFSANRYTVAANSTLDILVPDLPDTMQYAQATISRPRSERVPDYLTTDNTAYAVFQRGGVGQVLVVTERNIFLEQMFGSLPGIELTVVTPDQGLPEGDYDLYVFDGWLPSQIPEGDLLFINPSESTPFFDVSGTSNETAIDPQTGGVSPDEPRTLFVDFSNISIRQFRVLERIDWATPLVVTATGSPLVLAGEQNGQQIAIFTFALQDSDLPLQLTFPILTARLMEWYSARRAINVLDSLEPGTPLVIRPSVDADAVRITAPDGEEIELMLEDSPQVVFGDTRQTGLYRLDILLDERAVQREFFAVNSFDITESTIAPADRLFVQTGTGLSEISSNADEVGRRELWTWLALFGLIILVIEWVYYYRTIRRKAYRTDRRTWRWKRTDETAKS